MENNHSEEWVQRNRDNTIQKRINSWSESVEEQSYGAENVQSLLGSFHTALICHVSCAYIYSNYLKKNITEPLEAGRRNCYARGSFDA